MGVVRKKHSFHSHIGVAIRHWAVSLFSTREDVLLLLLLACLFCMPPISMVREAHFIQGKSTDGGWDGGFTQQLVGTIEDTG